jgi:transposase
VDGHLSGERGRRPEGPPRPGAKPRLSKRQEKAVLSWNARSPRAFGYPVVLWTTRRLAEVIEKRYGIRFNSNYLAEWLTRRVLSP